MSTAVKLLQWIWTCWKLNLASAMEYRLSFILTAGMMVVNDLVWIFFWSIFFTRFPVINGWELQDVVMMWAVGAGGFGLMAVLFGNTNRLANLIATGQLDVYLAQPKPVLLHILISRMSVSAIGDVAFAFIMFAIFGDTSWLGMVKFGAALLLSMLIYLFFLLLVNSLAFYIGNAEGISFQFFNALLAFSTYPTDIFKGWGRLILFTVIPAGFISYLPIGLLNKVQLPFLWSAIAFAIGLGVGSVWVFHLGLKRYSSGNMMIMRS